MKVVILYNPNSTGDGKANASALVKDLRSRDVEVRVQATTHAGHGLEIADKYAKLGEEMVLISASGDGGYHEVINGALPHVPPKIIVGVLPSGNANDHYTAIGTGDLAESIARRRFRRIDTIKVSATVNGEPWVRYAHSYVGIGVTASAAKKLTDHRPDAITEKFIVVHALFSYRYAKVREGRKTKRYSSLVFSNINTMSKVLKLSERALVTDGKFEMSAIRFHSKFRLIAYLLTAATIGLKKSRSLKVYRCVPTRRLPIQLDGEVYVIDAGSKVRIESVRRNLRCVL